MQFVGKVVSTVTEFYKDINPATLSGAIDIVVVEQPDKELKCSPFHVRFGKLQLLRPQEKVVEVRVNGETTDLHMKVGEAGEAFFVVKTENPVPSEYATSPIPSPQPLSQDEEIEPLYLNDEYDEYYMNNEVEDYVSAKESEIDINDYPTDDIFKRQQLNKNIKKSLLSDIIMKNSNEINIVNENKNKYFDEMNIEFDTIKRRKYQTKEETQLNLFNRKLYLNKKENDLYNYHSYTIQRNIHLLDYKNIPSSYPGSGFKFNLNSNNTFLKNPDSISIKKESFANKYKKYPSQKYISNNEINNPITIQTEPYIEDSDKDKQWSWRWGSLPTEDKPHIHTNEFKNKKNKYTATSMTSTNEISYDNKSISYKEKVDRYFASTESRDNPSLYEYNSFINIIEVLKYLEISISNCKFADILKLSDEAANELFEKNIITFEIFCKNPSVLEKNDLVCKINKRYYNWKAAEVLILSILLFRKPLTSQVIEKISQEQNNKRHGFGWRQWWRRSNNSSNTNNNNNNNNNNKNNSNENSNDNDKNSNDTNNNNINNNHTNNNSTITENPANISYPSLSFSSKTINDPHSNENHLNQETYENMLYDFLTPSSPELSNSKLDHVNEQSSPQLNSINTGKKDKNNNNEKKKNEMSEDDFDYYHYFKTLRLSSDKLKSLNLKKGVNTISFSVTTKLQGTATCVAKIYFWDMSTQVVISDVDGTITKSDALGHLFTFVGKDWTHSGVANLYTNIYRNGYQILYLTSRAIGQSNSTRGYLKKVEQGQYQLPDGPIIMSPDRLFKSLHREMIIKKPEDFKIAALSDIKSLWGDRNPFYAGFGNRITDALSYKKVDVPTSRIFTIDSKGDVKLELLSGYKSSYGKLNDLVDQIFPPINEQINSDFNDYNYWKSPFPEIEIDMSILEDKKENEQIQSTKINEKGNSNNNNQKTKYKKNKTNEKIISSSDSEESKSLSKEKKEKNESIKYNDKNDRKIVINDLTDGEILNSHDEFQNEESISKNKNNNDNKSIKSKENNKDESSSSNEEEEEEMVDAEQISLDNDAIDEYDLQLNKDEITAYIDDLLIEDDDPTEKLDLAAYPYL